jgi:SpoVK/Ycf46/Vps4 family AAA+-type ATPase
MNMVTNDTNNIKLDLGTYELIQSRLQAQTIDLVQRLNQLNDARKAVFASEQFSLIANHRISTENNGIARGILAIGDVCLFAYNVHFGLREHIELKDVFGVYKLADKGFEPQPLTILEDEQFIADFTNLYKYYRDAIFAKFRRTEHYVYMVFQTSKNHEDRKAFKWLLKDNKLTYIDDRSMHEVVEPRQFSFEWQQTTLEDRRLGLHPHVSILDKLFIEAIGGDITFKIEDNTDTGKGIYSEPVINKDQQLDDASYSYADFGNIIVVKIKPYQEEPRSFIFNTRTKEVTPVAALLTSGIELPEAQGLIFANGYYLQNGTYKLFDTEHAQLQYIRTINAPNGEDYLYVFYQASTNTYVLMSYNVILQSVATPIVCNGFTVFEDGKLIYFKSTHEAIRHHQVQIWQTPYSLHLKVDESKADNAIYKIGNKDIVRAMSEVQEVVLLAQKEDSYEALYEDIERKSNNIIDAYFWISDTATYNLAEPLGQIRDIAHTAIDEFAKVQEQKRYAQNMLLQVKKDTDVLFLNIRNISAQNVNEFVALLAEVRQMQGRLIDVKQTKYIDADAIDALTQALEGHNAGLAQQTVDCLLQADALSYYENLVAEQRAQIQNVSKVIEGQEVEQAIKDIADKLGLLVELLNSLKIDDTTQTTQIVANISLLFGQLNETKNSLAHRIKDLKTKETHAVFSAQISLLEQSLVNYMDLAATQEQCEDYFAKISVQVEEIETQFADFEDFLHIIADKRDDIIKAFEARREQLQAQRNKKAAALEQIAQRVLQNVGSKALRLKSREEIFAFFSTDLMVDKLRKTIVELNGLEEAAKAEHIETALKTAQEEALRQLKDRTELFVDGINTIALGEYKFTVNTQQLALTIIRNNSNFFFHILGTSFYRQIEDSRLQEYTEVWNQELVSENNVIYRGAYLAHSALKAIKVEAAQELDELVKSIVERDVAAAYLKGVHDADAVVIANVMQQQAQKLGALKYNPKFRAAFWLLWLELEDSIKAKLHRLVKAALFMQEASSKRVQFDLLEKELRKIIEVNDYGRTLNASTVYEYLVEEWLLKLQCSISGRAKRIRDTFLRVLQEQHMLQSFHEEIKELSYTNTERFALIQSWIMAVIDEESTYFEDYVQEAALSFLLPTYIVRFVEIDDELVVGGLKGIHDTIQNHELRLPYYILADRLSEFEKNTVLSYKAFQHLKKQMAAAYEEDINLDSFRPKVLTSFMRNRLINEVYFPLIGANLSKQIGAAGDQKRTDRMGLLLLLSPPGYGKTTLMEYLAKTMGLHFVKIDGPSLGHHVTSIDPAEVKSAAAKAELRKVNLALEMADNVMLYLDDIQHCAPEFLQKFISLADGQRKMEGVFDGKAKTYDLRGKRFCIVMAGNPYTESGQAFKIPDMLANRADVYNLGDVIGDKEHLFNLSLLENAIPEQGVLKSIASQHLQDFYKLVHFVAQQEEMLPELKGSYSRQDLDSAVNLLQLMLQVRKVIVAVNQTYIASAGTQDEYRKEPPFKLQGSYRNMNRIVAKLVPLMNENELQGLILSHYEQEAQTLTSGAEANLLKVKAIMNILSPEEEERWKEIKSLFVKQNKSKHQFENEAGMQIAHQLEKLQEQLGAIAQFLSNSKN